MGHLCRLDYSCLQKPFREVLFITAGRTACSEDALVGRLLYGSKAKRGPLHLSVVGCTRWAVVGNSRHLEVLCKERFSVSVRSSAP